MLNKNMSKSEIEKELEKKGDYVKIDNLGRFLKENLPLENKKFVCIKLATIYEDKGMFADAAKLYETAAIISITFSDKVKYYIMEAKLYIKAVQFARADEAMKKASSEAIANERPKIYQEVKDFYITMGLEYEKKDRRVNGIRIYEKLLEMNITEDERKLYKEKLMKLYEKTGKLKEYFTLKRAGV